MGTCVLYYDSVPCGCPRRREGQAISNEILTTEDVAAILKQTPEQVHKLLGSGALPGRRIGGAWYVSHRQLLAYIEQGDAASPAKPKPKGAVLPFTHDWECESCHTKNDAERVECKMCGAARVTPLMGYMRRDL